MGERLSLRELVAAELARPADERVREVAAAIAERYGAAARAVLFYGSCLRTGEIEGGMLDFYLIVSDYRSAYAKRWLAAANRLLPPNVFPFEHRGLAAKYAVLSEADFERECGLEARSVSVWARFSQPARIAWVSDEAAREAAAAAVARAVPTLLAMAPERGDVLERFRAGFALTYSAELRAEGKARPDAIVAADPERYRAFGEAALSEGLPKGRPRWRAMRAKGKALSVARLAKASFTFAGGIDYLAWKINRHSGTAIEIKQWQRRWPLVAGLILLPRLLRRRAIR